MLRILDLLMVFLAVSLVGYLVFPSDAAPAIAATISAYEILKHGIFWRFGTSDLILSGSLLAVWWHHALANPNVFSAYPTTWYAATYLSSCILVHGFAATEIWFFRPKVIGTARVIPTVQPNLLQGITLAWCLMLLATNYLTYGDLWYVRKLLLAAIPIGCVFLSRKSQRDSRYFPLLLWLTAFGVTYSLREGAVVRFFREPIALDDFEWLPSVVFMLCIPLMCWLNRVRTEPKMPHEQVIS